MSAAKAAAAADDDAETLHPRATSVLFGHAEAERTLLDTYRSGRIPHAWLIAGERGIGKATLAFRMARFVLAHPNPAAPAVQKATSLAVPADHPVAKRIAAQAQPDLLVLERTLNEKGKLRQDIAIEQVRDAIPFFGSTAGEGGWRVAIVDSLDELNPYGANALLKIVEEPPPRALLLLVSHAPGRVLPTIRSRCRSLMLRPLTAADVARSAASAIGAKPDEKEVRSAAEAAGGSVGRALAYLESDALELRQQAIELLDRLPQVDPRALHDLGDELAGFEVETLTAFLDTVNGWMSARLTDGPPDPARMARMAEAFEQINRAGRDVAEYNLDRKPLVFTVFGLLADAVRR